LTRSDMELDTSNSFAGKHTHQIHNGSLLLNLDIAAVKMLRISLFSVSSSAPAKP